MGNMVDAITKHRATWQAFQDAPAVGKKAERAELAEHDAIDVLLRTAPTSAADVVALKAHLDWYVVEEVQRRDITPEMFALHAAIGLAEINATLIWRERFTQLADLCARALAVAP